MKKVIFLYFHFWTILSISVKFDRKFDKSLITFTQEFQNAKQSKK